MRVVFDRFVFDSERRELLDSDVPIHLGPKAFRLLQILLDRAPRALSKSELQEEIWPGTYIEESGVAGLVSELRTALGDSATKPRFIRTVHGFGYAFCGDVPASSARTRAGAVVWRGQEIPLFTGTNVLGRDASADVCVDDSTVSRRHATITIGAGEAFLEDLDSKNGTMLEGEKVTTRTPLCDGATFVLGDATLIFRAAGASTSTVSAVRVRKATHGGS